MATLKNGDQTPSFSLVDQEGKSGLILSADWNGLGNKLLVL